jgi:hypothetical protein
MHASLEGTSASVTRIAARRRSVVEAIQDQWAIVAAVVVLVVGASVRDSVSGLSAMKVDPDDLLGVAA